MRGCTQFSQKVFGGVRRREKPLRAQREDWRNAEKIFSLTSAFLLRALGGFVPLHSPFSFFRWNPRRRLS